MVVEFDYASNEICFIGDTHGNASWWQKVFRRMVNTPRTNKETPIRLFISVGDFGYWDHTDVGVAHLDWLNNQLHGNGAEILFIRGNHENHWGLMDRNQGKLYGPDPIEIRDYIGWLPDGSTISIGDDEKYIVAAFGGAVSPDRPYRQRYVGQEWWAEEEITEAQLNYFCSNVDHCDIMVAHDGPSFVPLNKLLGGSGFSMDADLQAECDAGREFVTAAVEHAQPKYLINGHFHNHNISQVPGRPLSVTLDKDGPRGGGMDRNVMTLERLLSLP